MNKIKKADLVFISIILLVTIFAVIFLLQKSSSSTVTINIDGDIYNEYHLNHDEIIEIDIDDKKNIIQIKDKKVSMTYSNCPDNICVNQGQINSSFVPIVCLPHKIIVSVENSNEDMVN